MKAEKALAKLNAKTNGFDIGCGGHGGITQADIAGACACLSNIEYSLLWMKYVSCIEFNHYMPKQRSNDYLALYRKIMEGISQNNPGWEKNPAALSIIVMIAIYDSIDQKAGKCKRCGGSGKTSWGTGCKKCGEEGQKKRSGAEMARLIGVDKGNWSRTWKGRYESIVADISEIEQRGLSKVWRQINK